MRRTGALLSLIFCALAAPAAARGVHMVLKVDVPAVQADKRDEIMAQCMEVVSRRLDNLGIESAKLSVDRPDRIVADIPDYSDLAKLRETIDRTKASLSFRLVDEEATDTDIRAGHVPRDVDIVEQRARGGKHLPPLALYRKGSVSGERIELAHADFDQRSGEPTVEITFDALGKSQFEKFTEDNVGKHFAIVLDGKVVSAPDIREPILGGSGMIVGTFTVQEASDLAASLTGGAVPAPWTIVELKQTP